MRLSARITLILATLCFPIYIRTDYWQIPKRYAVLPTRGSKFAGLPDLSKIYFPEFSRPNTSQELGPLDVPATVGQRNTLKLLVEQFERVMISLHLQDQWFLSAGTLVGSLQHHDLIPWDDDADLMVHIRHRPMIQAALRNLSPSYIIYDQIVRDKLFFPPLDKSVKVGPTTIGGKVVPNKAWAWPFIDISYFIDIGANLGQEHHDPRRKFKLIDLYPVIYRPFGKHWYPTPRRPISFLKSFYRTKRQICTSHFYSHIMEKRVEQRVIECRTLLEKYPIVHRCRVWNWKLFKNTSELCDEYLVDGKGAVLHKIQTQLDRDECESPLFTVRHESFKCP
ncbi:hypothetical protein Aperf_G00000054264 [Anoplocephala perfoliata]